MNPQFPQQTTQNAQNAADAFTKYMQQGGQPTPQPQPNGMLQNILQFGLPTGGAILGGMIPGLGETGISEAGGAAAGQYVADKLTGVKPGADVAITGAFGGLGPALGKALAGVGGKAAGITNSLLGKPNAQVFTTVVQKDPFMLQNTAKLTQTAQNLGYLDKPVVQSLLQMPQDFENINKQITASIAKNNTKIPLVSGENNLLSNFTSQLEKSAYGPGDAGYDSSVNSILNKITSLGSGETDAATIYKEKSAMSQILANTFDKQAKGATLLPKEEAHLAYFNALKDSLDKFGSEDVRALNGQQNQMYDIAKAFGTQYAKQAGKRAPEFGFRDLLGIGGSAELFHMLGFNPLLGGALAAGAEKAVQNPTLMGILSKGLGAAGSLAKSPLGIATGVNTGQTLTQLFGGQSADNSKINSTENSQNQSQNNIPSFLSPNVTQSSTNSNHMDAQGNVQAFDGKTTFPSQLPEPSQISNAIPGQPYPQEQYMADIQKADEIRTNNPYNPAAQEIANGILSDANARQQANDQYVALYTQQNGLDSQQVQFVRSIPPLWQSMNDLRGLITTEGGRDVFQTVLNDNPMIQQLKAKSDQSGQYGRMLQLMHVIGEETARVNQGGPPSNLQTTLNAAFSPGNNVATNLANLDQAQGQMLKQYEQYLPNYGLSLKAGGQAQIQTGSHLLNNLLQQAGQ